MKHFIIEATYIAPLDKVKAATARHRAFLQQAAYDSGTVLCSGPQEPPLGGLGLARADSIEELEAIFQNDPLVIEHLATYRFREFHPVKHQPWTEDWFR